MSNDGLPSNINEIIQLSIKQFDLYGLKAWLFMNKITIRVGDSDKYRIPTQKDLEALISKTIKAYYFRWFKPKDEVTKLKYFYGVDISPDTYQVGGFSLINQDNYFSLDFYLYDSDDEGQLYYEKSYLAYHEGNRFVMLNTIGREFY